MRTVLEMLKSMLEVAAAIESPTKKDREKYIKNAQVGSGRIQNKIPVVSKDDMDSKLIVGTASHQ